MEHSTSPATSVGNEATLLGVAESKLAKKHKAAIDVETLIMKVLAVGHC